MDLQKISKSGSLAYLRVLQAQKQCNKFQNFDVSTKKVIVTQKCNHDSCLPLVLSIFNLPCQLWRVIIFEFLSVCAEIFNIIWSHIYLSSGKVSSESEMGHVPTFENLIHLTWNDPIETFIIEYFLQKLIKLLWKLKKNLFLSHFGYLLSYKPKIGFFLLNPPL